MSHMMLTYTHFACALDRFTRTLSTELLCFLSSVNDDFAHFLVFDVASYIVVVVIDFNNSKHVKSNQFVGYYNNFARWSRSFSSSSSFPLFVAGKNKFTFTYTLEVLFLDVISNFKN